MLIDTKIKSPCSEVELILALLSGKNKSPEIKHIRTGVYISDTVNSDMYINKKNWESWWVEKKHPKVSSYGVCDNPEQLLSKAAYKKLLNSTNGE